MASIESLELVDPILRLPVVDYDKERSNCRLTCNSGKSNARTVANTLVVK